MTKDLQELIELALKYGEAWFKYKGKTFTLTVDEIEPSKEVWFRKDLPSVLKNTDTTQDELLRNGANKTQDEMDEHKNTYKWKPGKWPR